MATIEISPSDEVTIVQSYEILEQKTRAEIGLYEARTARLMSEVFQNTHTAENGMRKLMRRRGLEHVIDLLQSPSFGRDWHFGKLRVGLFGWRQRAMAAALRELPDALRDLQRANDQLRDLRYARAQVRVSEPPRELVRDRVHDRRRPRER